MTIRLKTIPALAGIIGLALPAAAAAQSAGSSGMGSYQAGYGGSRYTTARPQTGSTRDQNGNRLIVDGIIQAAANSYSSATGGVSSSFSGVGGLEPVQLAVRALIERATVEFMANLYGAPGPEICLSAGPDPLGGTTGPTGGYYPAYPNTGTNNGETRADPSRWHDRRDGAVRRSRY